MRICSNNKRVRPGYTLFELMLVLAILVAVGAVAVRIFTKSFEIERLRKAGDVLRTAWAKARVEAMTTGQTYVFRFDYGVDRFLVQLWQTGNSENVVAPSTDTARAGCRRERRFTPARRSAACGTAETEAAGGQRSPQIFFYADGTTSTAQVTLTKKRNISSR